MGTQYLCETVSLDLGPRDDDKPAAKVWTLLCEGCDDGAAVSVHATKESAIARAVSWGNEGEGPRMREHLETEGWCRGIRNTVLTIEEATVES